MAAFTVIDHTEAGTGGVAYWEESSIASSYDHLLVKASVRSEGSGYIAGGIAVNLNGDTGYEYTYISMEAQTATPTSGGGGSAQQYASSGALGGTSILADTFTTFQMWIPHYSNTANFKQMLVNNAIENNSTTDDQYYLYVGASLYSATPAAIHTVKLSINAGDDFAEFSTFTLYGVTGA